MPLLASLHANNYNDSNSNEENNDKSPPSPPASSAFQPPPSSSTTNTATALAFPTSTPSTFLSNLLPPSHHQHIPTAEETLSLLLHAYFYLLILLIVYLNHTFDTLSPTTGVVSLVARVVVYGSLLVRGWEVAFLRGGMRGGMTPRRENHSDGNGASDGAGAYRHEVLQTAWLWWNIGVTFVCLDMVVRMDGVGLGESGFGAFGEMREAMTSTKTAARVLALMAWVGVLVFGEWKLREGEEEDEKKERDEDLLSGKGPEAKKARARSNVLAARKVYGLAANKRA